MSQPTDPAPTPHVEGFDPERFRRLVDGGFINTRRSDDGSLWLFDYSPKAQYCSRWTPETLVCRGLVCDIAGEVVARPFPKFFNLSELESAPSGPHTVFEKLDGSLGIVRVDGGGRLAVSTRGAFGSAQAVWATEHLRASAGSWLPPGGVTLCVEIIYPDNRVVVDYGARAELVALAAIDNGTGRDVELPADWPGPVAEVIEHHGGDLAELVHAAGASRLDGAQAEGWVVRFDSGERVKVKFPAYVELHRVLTGMTARTVWELLRGGGSLNELLAVAPDELHAWLRATAGEITSTVHSLERQARELAQMAPEGAERRELAAWVLTNAEHPHLVFAQIDGKLTERYHACLWELARPGPDIRPQYG